MSRRRCSKQNKFFNLKMITFFITLLLSVAMLCSSCSVTGNREKTLLGNPVVKVPTLFDKTVCYIV